MLSSKLADFIDALQYENLPQETIRWTRLAFLDWLGSALCGGGEKPATLALRVIRAQGGLPMATLLPSMEKTSALNAALGNGIASHIVELDDVHRGSVLHAGTSVIPAALAAAEMVRASGRSLIESIVAGYEVGIRIGEAVTPSHYYYFHNTGTCGTFGACAAAGKLLGLDRKQMISALGSAGTQAAGLWEFLSDGAMSKHLHAGKACQNGLLAALLAREGFTGTAAIIEGKRGFCRAMAPEFDLDKITRGLGKPPYKVEDNSFKIHSSCRHTHPAVDIVLDLRKRIQLKASDVASIKVLTYQTALDITDNHDPRTIYAAKFSLPFCVGLALIKGSCGMDDFTEKDLNDPEIRRLMGLVKLAVDDDLNSAHPSKWAAVVEITTRSGDLLSGKTDFPLGDPENPVDEEVLAAKFRRLAMRSTEKGKVEALLESVFHLEEIEDMAILFQ